MKKFLLSSAIATGLLVGCSVSNETEPVPEPVPTTVHQEVGLIPAQACINFPFGTPVPKEFAYSDGKWGYNGKIIAEVRGEDSDFHVCGSPEYIEEIAALERHPE